MYWKEIELTDMEVFEKAFGNMKSQASEMVFSNVFMWRKSYNTRFAMIQNMLCMVSNSKRYVPFAFCPIPLGEFRPDDFVQAVAEIRAYFNAQGWKLLFGRVEERMVSVFKKYLNTEMKVKRNEASSDYIYKTEKLISLSGKKLSSKRNHINKFLREYGSFEYVAIDRDRIDACKRIFEQWCEKNETSDACDCDEPANCEKWACFQLLDNWEHFPGMKGALIQVNGVFEAFTIGEMLNDETAVIHIEKGNTDIHGIYTLINREFVRETFSHTKYVNREEDMGKEGLRKAKMSYKPAGRIHKFNIYPEFR